MEKHFWCYRRPLPYSVCAKVPKPRFHQLPNTMRGNKTNTAEAFEVRQSTQTRCMLSLERERKPDGEKP